jgi:hypothetical protein
MVSVIYRRVPSFSSTTASRPQAVDSSTFKMYFSLVVQVTLALAPVLFVWGQNILVAGPNLPPTHSVEVGLDGQACSLPLL